jgi:hypothetical protein
MKNFNGRPFFSLFFIARDNQKIPNLALGRQSKGMLLILAAERQDPDFLIGPRNEKQRKKRVGR